MPKSLFFKIKHVKIRRFLLTFPFLQEDMTVGFGQYGLFSFGVAHTAKNACFSKKNVR